MNRKLTTDIFLYTILTVLMMLFGTLEMGIAYTVVKVFLWGLYIYNYFNSNKKKLDIFYLAILITFFVSIFSYKSLDEYITNFDIVLLAYTLGQLGLFLHLYTKYLKKQSILNLLFFSSPFLIIVPYLLVYLEIPTLSLEIRFVIVTLITSLSGGASMMVYSLNKNLKTYLLMIGALTWMSVGAFVSVFMWFDRNEIFYTYMITFEVIAYNLFNHAICIKSTKQWN